MKKLIKRFLMLLQVGWHKDVAPKVVFYHDVGTQWTPMGTPDSTFWAHMAALNEWKDRGIVHQVCFDDGFRGIWDEREKFRMANLSPKVFVAVRLVGQPGYLTWDEIAELQNGYGFDFQCHTWTHQTLSGEMIDESPKEERTEAWYRRELTESREELSKRLGKEVQEVCFPVGYFNEAVIRRCAEAGYKVLYASFPGTLADKLPSELGELCCSLDISLVPRNLVQDFPLGDFKLVLKGGMAAFKRRYLSQHWKRV